MRHVAVVGAGLGGVRAAEALRREGFDGELTVIGAETHAPYDRPPLSKEFLLGKTCASEIALCDDELRSSLRARWLLGRRATGLAEGTIMLDDEQVRADGVVIATGARARSLPHGVALDGVGLLRTLDDAVTLRDSLASSARLVVIGAGFVGTEVASTAAGMGVDVVVVDIVDQPFRAQLGPSAAELLCRTIRANGVQLRTGVEVTGIVGERWVEAVLLSDGTRLMADLVLIGVGAVPNTEWLATSSVRCQHGIATDPWGRTNVPGVVAAGDVAAVARPGGRLRIEHWTNARDMPGVAVRTLLADAAGLDPGPPHSDPPYFWSEQFGQRIQLAGRIHPDQPVEIVEGTLEEGRFVGVQRRDGSVTAVLGWSMPREFGRLRRSHKGTLRFAL